MKSSNQLTCGNVKHSINIKRFAHDTGYFNGLRTWYLFGPALAATRSRPSTSAYRLDGESSHSALTCAMNAASLTIMASLVVYDSTAYLQPAADEATAHSDSATRMQWVGVIAEFGKPLGNREKCVRVITYTIWRTDTVDTRPVLLHFINSGSNNVKVPTVTIAFLDFCDNQPCR